VLNKMINIRRNLGCTVDILETPGKSKKSFQFLVAVVLSAAFRQAMTRDY